MVNPDDDFELIARTAIEAMREPTEAMNYAAMSHGMQSWQSLPMNIGYDVAWRAMIDEALK